MTKVELDAVPQQLWRHLREGRGPWRSPVLASCGEYGADARMVVVREVSEEKRCMTFFTNRDSRKQSQLATGREVCLLAFDAEAGTQWRMYGAPREISERARLDGWWQALGEQQRRHYGENDAAARRNFAAWMIEIKRLHVLWLRADGNQAAEFAWDGGHWRGRPVPA